MLKVYKDVVSEYPAGGNIHYYNLFEKKFVDI